MNNAETKPARARYFRQLPKTFHGLSKTKLYRTWHNMVIRCHNPSHANWSRYGGRGITVCDRWINSFENFREDMGEAPEGKSLDRINNNQGYFKENCRWATPKEQQHNIRSNRWITFNGETMIASDWALRLGIKPHTLLKRIKKGEPVEVFLRPKEIRGHRMA